MEERKLKALLAQLHDALEQTEDLDSDTLEQVRELDDEIARLLDPEFPEDESGPVIDKAREVEARFAVDHPVAVRFLREIMDSLAKVGI
jgi:hypothetical protein